VSSTELDCSVDDCSARQHWSQCSALAGVHAWRVRRRSSQRYRCLSETTSAAERHTRQVRNSPVQRSRVQVRWRHRLFRWLATGLERAGNFTSKAL